MSKKKNEFSLIDLYNLINERSDRIESKVSENAVLVEDLREKVDFIYNEVAGFRIEMDVLKQKHEAYEQKIAKLEERLSDVERYGRVDRELFVLLGKRVYSSCSSYL